jgi:hypothetical protein
VDPDDLQVARQFLAALGTVAITGERNGLYPWLTSDVEWVTPMRVLTGIEEIREDLTWINPPADFDLEFEIAELTDLGGGGIVSEIRELYRLKSSGQVVHGIHRRIELAIRDRKVARYEMRIIGEEGQASQPGPPD